MKKALDKNLNWSPKEEKTIIGWVILKKKKIFFFLRPYFFYRLLHVASIITFAINWLTRCTIFFSNRKKSVARNFYWQFENVHLKKKTIQRKSFYVRRQLELNVSCISVDSYLNITLSVHGLLFGLQFSLHFLRVNKSRCGCGI